MMSSDPTSNAQFDLGLDVEKLTRSAINGIRIAFGVSGVAALILGIVLLIQPARTLAAVAMLLGIYFLISGVVRLAMGIFSRGISGGLRTLDILFGVLLIVAGVIALKNIAASTAALLILIVAVIGIGWIIEGVLAIVESRGARSTGWAITFGIVSIIAGIVVLAIPGWTALWLVTVSGILLIVLGVIGIIRAFTFGRAVLKPAS